MELDDLRRQWHKDPDQGKTSVAELSALLKQTSVGAIDRMRRNTWGEIATTVFVVAAALNFLFFQKQPVNVLYSALLVVVVCLMVVYYVVQIRILKRMAITDVSVRGHLRELCTSLRQLLDVNYKLTLWTGPATWLVLLGYYIIHEQARPGGPRLLRLSLVVGIGLVVSVVLQMGLLRLTRWWSQYRYGQHLDRLESQLRELDEPTT